MSLRIPLFILAASIASLHAAEVSGGGAKSRELKPAPREPLYPPKNSPDAVKFNFAKAKIPAGFTADVWAGEPLLANPVAFCFDPRGRMFVSETHRYRSSVLDIRHYYWMIEDDLANRNQDDWLASIKRNFPKDWQELEKESELVRLVEDSNGDGKADKSSVYADGFRSALDGIASGVLWHKDALYFANIPALWRLTGAEKAEKREELHRGYGVRFSYTGHDFHGLVAGPDGRLYFSIGDRGASIKTKEGTTIELPDEGAVFRCEPDGSRLELVMRGLRNPQELAFDDYGNLFTGDNDSDQGDRERWVAVIEGADAGWRIGYQHHLLGKDFNPWIAEHMWEPRDAKLNQPAAILSPIANLPDGPSGLVHYPGTGLPAEYAGSFFLAGYKGSTAKSAVNTFKCEPDGAGFKLTGLRVFMDNVQATDVDFGPDSRLYVSAWDEGWERTDQGRIYRLGHDAAREEQSAQIAEVQKILAEGFAQRTSEELVKLLAHADQRVRLGAQWALAERVNTTQDKSEEKKIHRLLNVALYAGVEGSRRDISRLHALWAQRHAQRLEDIKDGDYNSTGHTTGFVVNGKVSEAFDDPNPEIRAQLMNFVADAAGKLERESVEFIGTKLHDESSRVRFYAAIALARRGDASVLPLIIKMLRANSDHDQYLRHAGVMALAKCSDAAALSSAAKDDSRAVRLAALLAYHRLGNPAVAQFLNDKDPTLVAEAARAINDTPLPAAMPELAKLAFTKRGGPGAPAEIAPMDTSDKLLAARVLNANFRVGDNDGANRLALFAARAKDESLRLGALTMLAKWAAPPARDYITGTYRPLPARGPELAAAQLALVAAQLLADKSPAIAIAACDALAANGVKAAAPHLLALVRNAQAATKSRVAALNALAALATPELDAALASAAADPQPALKTAASKHLGKRDPAIAAKQLAAAFPVAELEDQKDILNALGGLSGEAADAALVALLGQLKAGQIAAGAQLELIEAAAKHEAAPVKKALAAYEAALAQNNTLAPFAWALEGGDAIAGEKVFKENAVAQCQRCHKVGGSGGEAGPELTGIAATRDRRYLLQAIIDPNATIAEGFQSVMLTMKDGAIQAGIPRGETATELTLQMPAPGIPPVTVKKADIKTRENAPSGMPPGIGNIISKRDLRDVLEYIATLKP